MVDDLLPFENLSDDEIETTYDRVLCRQKCALRARSSGA